MAGFELRTHKFPGQHIRQYPGATRYNEEDIQYLEVKQYVPTRSHPGSGDVTIIATQAVSFPKELYEPLFEDMLASSEAHGFRIRSIWAVDACHHGASGILNEHTQGDDPSLFDLGRDILLMTNLFRADMPHPIVGLGHSMGATALLHTSLMNPRLFASLILIDPIIGPSISGAGAALVHMSSMRPDLWPSREAAEKAFKSVKQFQLWDPRVLPRWLKYGLRDTPTLVYPKADQITLTTTKANESWSYARSAFEPLPPYATKENYMTDRMRIKYPEMGNTILQTWPFHRHEAAQVYADLPRIRPDCLFMFPAKGPMTTAEAMDDKVGRTGVGVGGNGGEKFGRVKKIIMNDVGHLAPFEKPALCAEIIGEWLGKDLNEWEERRRFERENRDDKSVSKTALSDEWISKAKDWFERTKAQQKLTAKAKI